MASGRRGAWGAARFLLGFLVVFGAHGLDAQNSLSLDDAVIDSLVPLSVPLTMTNDTDVQAYKLAVTYDASRVSVVDVNLDGTLFEDMAEGVFPMLFDALGGFTLGVFLDFGPPFDGQVIPPGDDQVIANIVFVLDAVVDTGVTFPLEFTDGVLNNPPVINALVLAGVGEIQAPELGLKHGSLTIEPLLADQVRVEDISIPDGGTVPARVLLTNPSGAVEGFTVTLIHGDALTLDGMDIHRTVTESIGAEFMATDELPDRGVITVVLDSEPPFDGQTIPVGREQPIANFHYRCWNPPLIPNPPTISTLALADGGVTLIMSGFSVEPDLMNGTATCEPVPAPNTSFLCGRQTRTGEITGIEGEPGQRVSISFFYTDPDDVIVAFQLALSYDCQLAFVDGTFSVEGTAAGEAEFVNASVDNDAGDGDGCEFTVGVLMDSFPPFNGQTMPATTLPLELGRVEALVDPGAEPDIALGVEFTDFVDGSEGVPLENVAVIDSESVTVMTSPCAVSVVPSTPFVRGNCDAQGMIGLGDAVLLLNHLFLEGPRGPCREACDTDASSVLNIHDAVLILVFVFGDGPPPAPPYPECGAIPGASCDAFGACP